MTTYRIQRIGLANLTLFETGEGSPESLRSILIIRNAGAAAFAGDTRGAGGDEQGVYGQRVGGILVVDANLQPVLPGQRQLCGQPGVSR